MSGVPTYGSNGDFLNLSGICFDIDSSETAALEMSILPENLPQMVWKIDIDGKVLYANKRFKQFVGAPEGTALNVFDKSVVHPDDHKSSLDAFVNGSAKKMQFSVKRRLKCSDGKYYEFLTKGIPVLNDLGQVVSWYGTCSAGDS